MHETVIPEFLPFLGKNVREPRLVLNKNLVLCKMMGGSRTISYGNFRDDSFMQQSQPGHKKTCPGSLPDRLFHTQRCFLQSYNKMNLRVSALLNAHCNSARRDIKPPANERKYECKFVTNTNKRFIIHSI